MSNMDSLVVKTKMLAKYLKATLEDRLETQCDEEALLSVYVHLQQAASVLMDQQIRHETKAKEDCKKKHAPVLPTSSLALPPQVCFRITYQSTLVIPEDKTPVNCIIPIVNHATENNQKLKIGGMLFCDVIDGKIIQVLEGDKTTILQLVSKIQDDPRHKDFEVLEEETARERKYVSWGMQFAQSSGDWDTVTKVIREQRRKMGLSRAKGFGSFQDLTDIPLSGITRMKKGRPLSGLLASEVKEES